MAGRSARGEARGRDVRVVVTGGGTGGHVYPALAVIERLRSLRPDAQVLYCGTPASLEERLALRAGLPFAPVPSAGLVGKSPVDRLRAFGAAGAGLAAALGHIRRFRPTAAFGTGGYASGPVVLAAALARVPTLLHEQNVFPGFTNRRMAPFVALVAVPHAETARYLPRRARIAVTGNPVRAEFFRADREAARQALGLAPDERLVLFVMGSRGSATVNRAIAGALPALLRAPRLRVHWITGRVHHEEALRLAEAALGGIGPEMEEKLVMEPYADAMAERLVASDLVVCRGGAITMAEVCAAGRAALVVPSPHLVGQRQDLNAEPLVAAGAARLLRESELHPERLAAEVTSLLADPEGLREMGRRAKALARPRAADDLAEAVIALSDGCLPRISGGA